MRRTPTALLIAALAAANLAGCGEKPPRPVPRGEQAYNVENGESRLRERAQNQGESSRISY